VSKEFVDNPEETSLVALACSYLAVIVGLFGTMNEVAHSFFLD
jgi:hypothetical protein